MYTRVVHFKSLCYVCTKLKRDFISVMADPFTSKMYFCSRFFLQNLFLAVQRKFFLVEIFEWLMHRRRKKSGAETLENGDSEPLEEQEASGP